MRRLLALWAAAAVGFVFGATLAFTRSEDVEEEELAPGVFGSRAGLRIVRDEGDR